MKSPADALGRSGRIVINCTKRTLFEDGWYLYEPSVSATDHKNVYTGTTLAVKPADGNRERTMEWEATFNGSTWSFENTRRGYRPETPFWMDANTDKEFRGFLSNWLNSNVLNIGAPKPAAITMPTKAPGAVSGKNGTNQPIELLVSEIEPFSGQPRFEFPEGDAEQMGTSLKQETQRQIIVVTPITDVPGKRWGLVDGERRYRGAKEAGQPTLLGIVRHYKNEDERFWDSFLMNLNRRGHTPIENSCAVARAKASGKSVAEIANAMGYTPSNIMHLLDLQRLHEKLRALMRESAPKHQRLGYTAAKVLSRVPDEAEQLRIWEEACKEKTPALRKLRVDQLAAPILATLPKRIRKTKPADNAVRILRILQTAEASLAFIMSTRQTDLHALLSYSGSAETGNLIKRIRATAEKWCSFRDRVSGISGRS